MAFRTRSSGSSWLRRAGVVVLALLLIVFIASFFIDEPLRRAVVRQMNQQLKGYSADIRQLRFHPIGLSLTLYDLKFVQQAHPDPPVFHAPRLDASVE
jgi:hypothetical protein